MHFYERRYPRRDSGFSSTIPRGFTGFDPLEHSGYGGTQANQPCHNMAIWNVRFPFRVSGERSTNVRFVRIDIAV
jgi:hypothetical protein